MTKRAEEILEGIKQLSSEEVEVILRALLRRLGEQKRVEALLDEYIGSGEGIWQTDAQQYVEALRQEEEPKRLE